MKHALPLRPGAFVVALSVLVLLGLLFAGYRELDRVTGQLRDARAELDAARVRIDSVHGSLARLRTRLDLARTQIDSIDASTRGLETGMAQRLSNLDHTLSRLRADVAGIDTTVTHRLTGRSRDAGRPQPRVVDYR